MATKKTTTNTKKRVNKTGFMGREGVGLDPDGMYDIHYPAGFKPTAKSKKTKTKKTK